MARGRPRTFETEVALDRAVQAFWRHGFEACSLSLLLDEMGLYRSSFYQAFGDKTRLFCTALERYCTACSRELAARLDASDSAFSFVRESLAAIAEGQAGQPAGCMLMNSAAELGTAGDPIRSAIDNGLERFRSVFRRAFERAQDEGDIPPDADSAQLSDFLIACICGLRTLSKAGVDAGRLRAIAAVGLRSLETGSAGRATRH